jgi:probable HAF family extracellular repeat protein
MRDIGTLGGRLSYGMSINASKHVAGYSTVDGSDDHFHAFFYDGKMIDLGSLIAMDSATPASPGSEQF